MRLNAIKKREPFVYVRPSPDPRLAGLVEYWSINSKGKTISRVMISPDKDLKVIFDFDRAGGNPVPYLLGIQLKPEVLARKRPVDIISVNFLPGSFYSLFQIPADRFIGKKLPLISAIGPRAAGFYEIFTKKTLKARVQCLNSILLDLAKTKMPAPPTIICALKEIYASNGKAKVISVAKTSGLSRFGFTRLFKKWVGADPRLYSVHLCFTKASRELIDGKSVYEVMDKFGYYDQSHFIRVFKRRMGWTPTMRFKPKRHVITAQPR